MMAGHFVILAIKQADNHQPSRGLQRHSGNGARRKVRCIPFQENRGSVPNFLKFDKSINLS